MSWKEDFYSVLPVPLQHCAVSSFGLYWHWLRFGPGYEKFVREYKERERFSQEQWKIWQKKRLLELIRIALKRVPYYRAWPDAVKRHASNGELNQLPLLDKASVRESPEAFLQDDMRPWPKIIFHTSGSTGTPIKSYWTASELRNSRALREVRSAGWANVSFRMPRATFSGRLAVPQPESRGPFYRYNCVEKQVYFSPFHLSSKNASAYVDALFRYKTEWMTGYAVSYYLLAQFILSQKIKVPPLRAVITTSEKLTLKMRQVMEKAYQCSVFEEYSSVENSLFASECEKGRLHVSPDAGIVEILRSDGKLCEPGEPGEVVATALIHDYQILLRYRLGDMAKWSAENCTCGRSMPVIEEVLGRIEDVVVGPDGRMMVRFHGIFLDQPHVIEGQIIQESLDSINVKIVPAEGFNEKDEESIRQRIHQRLGSGVRVHVEAVESIPRTKAGKFKAVISLLKSGSYE